MAARLSPLQDERTRSAIQTTKLVQRLQCFALDVPDAAGHPVEIDPARLRAIEILLKKTLPDLQAHKIEGTGDDGAVKVEAKVIREIVYPTAKPG